MNFEEAKQAINQGVYSFKSILEAFADKIEKIEKNPSIADVWHNPEFEQYRKHVSNEIARAFSRQKKNEVEFSKRLEEIEKRLDNISKGNLSPLFSTEIVLQKAEKYDQLVAVQKLWDDEEHMSIGTYHKTIRDIIGSD